MQWISSLEEKLIPKRIAVLLTLAILSVYGPSLHNSFLDFDDNGFITENFLITEQWPQGIIHAFSAPLNFLYIPLTTVSWQFTEKFFGFNPFWYHLGDMLIHVLNTMLVWVILERFTGKRFMAVLGALIFGVHPLNVEAIMWASSRKDILSACFALLSTYSYLSYAETRNRMFLRWSFGFFLLGLFAKISIAPLPVAFCVLDWLNGEHNVKKIVMKKWMYFVVALIFGVVGVRAGNVFLESIGIENMLLLASRGTALLLQLFFWPQTLNALRFQPNDFSITDVPFLLSTIVVGILAVTTLVLFLKRSWPLVPFGLAWFFLMLAPTLTAAQKAGVLFVVSDKYAYLPMLGLILVVLLCGESLLHRVKISSPLLVGFSAILIIVLGARTAVYATKWKDSDTLYQSILVDDPNNPIAKGSIAMNLDKAGKSEEALQMLKESIAADPENAVLYLDIAGLHLRANRLKEADAILEDMIPHFTSRQLRGDPGLRKTLAIVGQRLPQDGLLDVTEKILRAALKLAPETPELNAALGMFLVDRNQKEEAYTLFEKAAEVGSDMVEVYYHLAEFYAKANRSEDYERVLEHILEIEPNNKKAQEELRRLQ
jgi:protein O-mannosyl-transferase